MAEFRHGALALARYALLHRDEVRVRCALHCPQLRACMACVTVLRAAASFVFHAHELVSCVRSSAEQIPVNGTMALPQTPHCRSGGCWLGAASTRRRRWLWRRRHTTFVSWMFLPRWRTFWSRWALFWAVLPCCWVRWFCALGKALRWHPGTWGQGAASVDCMAMPPWSWVCVRKIYGSRTLLYGSPLPSTSCAWELHCTHPLAAHFVVPGLRQQCPEFWESQELKEVLAGGQLLAMAPNFWAEARLGAVAGHGIRPLGRGEFGLSCWTWRVGSADWCRGGRSSRRARGILDVNWGKRGCRTPGLHLLYAVRCIRDV